MKRFLAYVIILALILPVCFGATVKGTIYDIELNELDNVIMTLNSTPEQTYVSKDGTYMFILNNGAYSIKATYGDDYFAQEDIVINEEGEYVIDLFLEEELSIGFDESNFDEADIIDEGTQDDKVFPVYMITLISLVIIIALSFVIVKLYQNRKLETVESDPLQNEMKDDIEKVLSIIKKYGGRINQLDLRDELPFSEAKVSLIIKELEHKKILEKIKKGRGNILVLK